ncbi:acyltransferase [Mitsuaria sp. GD03876]|uniref:acyltransferase family protein n=1 Tax=Mitsuaria sp. GD03876 TaxID=2975399 RepID=UPI00244C8611|nr:acyltransferase [Mitsuaria sp. GD03876]MDH0865028.1 acyltransferase [Mitsuaria sp. GD03876]
MEPSTFRLGHRPALDGLRGFAVLCVMIFHAHTGFLEGGGLGVEIFFVLSGFLITTLLCEELDRYGNVDLKNFYARRALRLAPALLLLVFVYAVWSCLALDGGKARQNLFEAGIALTYTSNWARAFWWNPPDLLGHTWSLSIEEQFYLLWPVILLVASRFTSDRRKLALLALGLAALSLVWRNVLLAHHRDAERLFNGLDTRADALMIGCALALAFSRQSVEVLRRRWARVLEVAGPLALVFIAGVMLVSAKEEWREPYMYRWGFAAVELAAAVLMAHLLVNGQGLLARGFGVAALRWFGGLSYGLYLWHYPVYRMLRANGASPMEILVGGSVITILVALVSYHALEQPVLTLKKHFDRRKNGALEAPSSREAGSVRPA